MDSFLPDYHFIAIGGIGQSALAKILLAEGKKVSGSDISKSKYVKKLEDMGAKIFIGHSESNIVGNPTIVISSAIKDDNSELIEAKKRNLKIIHRSDLLKIISDNYPCFMGFSGTHGKTTTSGLCAYLLSKAGLKPAYAVGGIIPEINTNGDCEDKNTSFFAAELDESDGTIVKYSPKFLLINNLEADHLDFYKNGLEDVLKTFATLVKSLKSDAKVLINLDNCGNLELVKSNPDFKNFIGYAIENKCAKYRAENIKLDVLSSSFDLSADNTLVGKIELSIPGVHNISNALGVASMLLEAGVDFQVIKPYFKTFSGMGRRFQKSAEFNSIRVIDDYAHHPQEIKATLEAVKNYKNGRIVAIFQPHRYSRFQGFYDDFLDAFDYAHYVAVLDVYAAGEKFQGGKTPSDFANDLGTKAQYFEGNIEQAAKNILPNLQKNDIVFTFGAGDVTKMGEVLNGLHLLKK